MVTITGHISNNIFQTVDLPAVKFTRSNEKNELSSNTKISESLEKSKAIGPGSFKARDTRCLLLTGRKAIS